MTNPMCYDDLGYGLAPKFASGIGYAGDDIGFARSPKEAPMTIVAVWWESDDSILLAADSSQVEMPSGIRSDTAKKISTHPTAPIIWGMAGDVSAGITRFGEWILEQSWPPSAWVTFRDSAIAAMSEINGRQIEYSMKAGHKAEEAGVADILLVANIDGLHVLEIQHNGTWLDISHEAEFYAIGSGQVHAFMVYIAYKKVAISGLTRAQLLNVILETVSTVAPACSPPIHIWRITQDGMNQIQ